MNKKIQVFRIPLLLFFCPAVILFFNFHHNWIDLLVLYNYQLDSMQLRTQLLNGKCQADSNEPYAIMSSLMTRVGGVCN